MAHPPDRNDDGASASSSDFGNYSYDSDPENEHGLLLWEEAEEEGGGPKLGPKSSGPKSSGPGGTETGEGGGGGGGEGGPHICHTAPGGVGSSTARLPDLGLVFVDGDGSCLGSGSYGTVRLARRRRQRPVPRPEPTDAGGGSPRLGLGSCLRRVAFRWGCRKRASAAGGDEGQGQGDLVAVKVCSISALGRNRTLTRDAGAGRRGLAVRTALDAVENEIALLRAVAAHPNLVGMYEAIRPAGFDAIYLVLEYMPLGEILTFYPDDVAFRRRLPRPGEGPIEGVTAGGYFDEARSALFFVDVLHGLAHLHRHRICHRDLKPGNILLGAGGGVAKISDLGVAHHFGGDVTAGAGAGAGGLDDCTPRTTATLGRPDADSALAMKGMADAGILVGTEGTWCFWSPEMCREGGGTFSGYAADLWAAGVCLYIFCTGRPPLYDECPERLFRMIEGGALSYDGLGLSADLVNLLGGILRKEPEKRYGIGDCLGHSFLRNARRQRAGRSYI